jgi:hypothetical protein
VVYSDIKILKSDPENGSIEWNEIIKAILRYFSVKLVSIASPVVNNNYNYISIDCQ